MTKQHEAMIAGAVLGVGLLLTVKYLLLGLKQWNMLFHPGRQDDPAGLFYCPLLRIGGPCVEQVTHTISFE